jgi:thiol-disulfide isomerase/thioredoxin
VRPRTSLSRALPLAAGVLAAALAGCVRTEPRLPREPDETLVPAGGAAGASDADPLYRSFLGKPPPALPRRGTWVNASKPLSLEALRGRVVLLQFAFLGCAACRPLTPYLVGWHDRYEKAGLTVVYVDNGAADTREALEAAHVDEGTPFPLFHDRTGGAIAAYGVRAFPTVYVVDRSGVVVWEGVATGLEAHVEAAITAALARPAPKPAD